METRQPFIVRIAHSRCASLLACIILALIAAMGVVDASGSDATAEPLPRWLMPAHADEYLLIETGHRHRRGGQPLAKLTTVYHVPSREAVAADWPLKNVSQLFPVRLIQHAPGYVWQEDSDPTAVNLLSGERVTYFRQREQFLAADRRRMIIYEHGDIWRAEFDWRSGEAVNRHRVTQVGLFRQPLAPIIWHGNDIYLRAGFDANKPIVRVHLVSGEIEELPLGKTFDPLRTPQTRGNMGVNPPNSLIFRAEGQVIHTLDLRTGTTGQIPNPSGSSLASYAGVDLVWLNDTTAVASLLDARTRIERIVRLDFAAGQVHDLTAHDVVVHPSLGATAGEARSLDGKVTNVRFRGVLPGGGWAHVTGTAQVEPEASDDPWARYEKQLAPVENAPYLLNLYNGEIEPLNIEGDPPETEPYRAFDEWLDDRYYVFSRQEGGLASIGTWIHDRQSGKTRRLFQQPSEHGRIFLADSEAIAFRSFTGVMGMGEWHIVNIDGSRLEALPPGPGSPFPRVVRIDTDPIDLGFGDTQVDLWAEPR